MLKRLSPYLLIAPSLAFIVLFTLYPAAQTLLASLYQPARRAADAPTFVFLQNFANLFNPAHFIGTDFVIIFSNTLFFAFLTVVISVPLALLFAWLLNRKIRALALWRFAIFYPALLPMLGAASLWAYLFADSIGIFASILAIFGIENPNWLGDPTLALVSVTLVNIWKQSGYLMIFYLAGLQAIPRDVYEAASMEGATAWEQFWYITLPLLRRTTLFVLIVTVLFAFQTVEHLPALGAGGPGIRSNLMLYYIYQKIPERLNWGYVNAMTTILIAIVLSFTLLNMALFERKGAEDERA